ncbi:MAG TPA: heterodisulfide reductase-related iron-sulfur binding cluster [Limnochordia bacterium]|nr:heterodisulfide reductase-related iron-sulfur binding cluster [Limnochordia bacterium]
MASNPAPPEPNLVAMAKGEPSPTGLEFEAYLKCIHCGLCTAACPTYLETGSEADSPRGRIHMMRSVAEGRVPLDENLVFHLERCLDCRACQTACPSGVEYGRLIEDARARIEQKGLRSRRDRLLLALLRDRLFPYPGRMRLALWPLRVLQRLFRGRERTLQRLMRLLPGNLAGMAELVPPVVQKSAPLAAETTAQGEERYRVALLAGCVGSVMFGHVNAATARVLARNGCRVVVPQQQGCCGALHSHTGAVEAAKAFARRNIAAFAAAAGERPFDAILVNAAGCGSSLKEYGHLLADDPEWAERAKTFSGRVLDVSEFLARIELEPPKANPGVDEITYHDACHLLHGQGVRHQPRTLLRKLPGVELVPLVEADICCGSAGIYNLVQPEMADDLLHRKVEHIAATRAKVVVTGNPGCALQIRLGLNRAGIAAEVLHPIELLDRAYQAEGRA